MAPAPRAGRARLGRWLAAAVLLHVLSSAPASGAMQRLVGGSLTWEANPNFLAGGAKRTVTFHLRTSWAAEAVPNTVGEAQVPNCPAMTQGSTVACNVAGLTDTGATSARCNSDPKLGDGCSVAERFGVLCVAQLVRTQNDKYYAKYSDPNAQCVSEANAHLSSYFQSGSYLPDADKKPVVCGGASNCASKIGVPNRFTVQQVYSSPVTDSEEPSSVGRKPGPSVVVTGVLTHTVQIDSDVSEVVAWLAPRTGHANLDKKTGLLLEGCSSVASGTPCMYNECSLQRSGCADGQGCATGAAFRIESNGIQYAASDAFWDQWGSRFDAVQGCGSGKACLRKASPALETFVPLCSNDQASKRKCSLGMNNYYSPVTSLPDLIEVAITPATTLSASVLGPQGGFVYTSYNPYNPAAEVELTAPHQAFRVQSFDYDGQQMTQYSPQLYSELKAGGNGHKMGLGDFDIAVGANPGDMCTVSQDSHCCKRGTPSAEPVRSMRVDCVAEDVPPTGFRRWPAVTKNTASSGVEATEISGCRFIFDYDRDQLRRQGNLIKPDFAFSDVQNKDKHFTQHVMNTIDFPFSDVDNPVAKLHHIDNQQLNWAPLNTGGGQSIVQNVFSMFACISGTENQPPVFTTSLASTDVRVNTVYECPFYLATGTGGPCSIDLYARDFRMSATGVDSRTSGTPVETVARVDIQYAIGYDHLPTAHLEPAGDRDQCLTGTGCLGHAHFRYHFKPDEWMDSVTGFLRPDSIGKMVVRCFVAYDVFIEQTASARSCPSMPLCIKIKVTGSKPQFVAPTPLGESFDDNGILVPNRHDFAACQGFPMKMQLTVKDSMPEAVRKKISESEASKAYLDKLKFRIFVEDKDVGFDRTTDLKASYKFLQTGGVGNLDFFSTDAVTVESLVEQKCGAFGGYGAGREGNNDDQQSPDPMATGTDERGKSVMSAYKSTIEYCSCSSHPCSQCATSNDEVQASLTVVFESDPAAKRGVALRDAMNCKSIDFDDPDSMEWEMANCREKLTSMDQVICAVGYDNARSVYKRWVGDTDPNGDDRKHWRRDHSNGDQASDMHCFRILIAAPPVFVTDPTGTITPFSDRWSEFVDTTGEKAAYKRINFRVNQTRELTFLAQVSAPLPVRRALAPGWCAAARAQHACPVAPSLRALPFDCGLWRVVCRTQTRRT